MTKSLYFNSLNFLVSLVYVCIIVIYVITFIKYMIVKGLRRIMMRPRVTTLMVTIKRDTLKDIL